MSLLARSPDKLHRLTHGQNDWDNIPDSELTRQQRIAKRTAGVATIACATTAAGAGLFAWGAYDVINGRPLLGAVKMALGKACDWLDGNLVEKFKVKGRFGRGFDATVDAVSFAGATALMAGGGIIPMDSAGIVLTQRAVETAAVLSATARHK